MYYEINVARKEKDGVYRHFFATAPRSITEQSKAVVVLKEIVAKFSKPEYDITINYHEESATFCDAEDFLKNPDLL